MDPEYCYNLAISITSPEDRQWNLFVTTQQSIHLNNVILASQAAVDQDPALDLSHAKLSFRLGLHLAIRYNRIRDLADLNRAIAAFTQAVELTSDDSTLKPTMFAFLGGYLKERYQCTGQPADLEQAISTYRSAAELTPDDYPEKTFLLTALSGAHVARFRLAGELYDLEQAVRADRLADELTPVGDPDKPGKLNNLSSSLLIRFELNDELGDLEQAIDADRRAIELMTDSHPDMPRKLSDLHRELLMHFERTGGLDDIEQAISTCRRGVELVTDDSLAERTLWLTRLGSSLSERYDRTAQIEDLEQAIDACHRVAKRTPDDHPDCLPRLGYLRSLVLTHFQRAGYDLEDLEQLVAICRRGVDFMTDDHPDKSSWSCALGGFLALRFETTGEFQDLEQAISACRHGFELANDDDSDRPMNLIALGKLFDSRFDLTSQLGDVDQAIPAYRRAIELTPDGHSDKAMWLSWLGRALVKRFQHNGLLEDLENAASSQSRAVELTSEEDPEVLSLLWDLCLSLDILAERTGNHVHIEPFVLATHRGLNLIPKLKPNDVSSRARWLSITGRSLAFSFGRTGELEEVDQAISHTRIALDCTPPDDSMKGLLLANLGAAFLARFRRTGELEDIEQAISAFRYAIESKSDDIDSIESLINLSLSFHERFKRFGDFEDIERAITHSRKAAELMPVEHPSQSKQCNSLGLALLARFQRTGELDDIEQAIWTLRRAIELNPVDDSHQSPVMHNLAISLRNRFERTEEFEDLERAISAHRRAVELTPDDHPEKPLWLDGLGNSLLQRFLLTNDLENLGEVLSIRHRVLELTPDNHPFKPDFLFHLALALRQHFTRISVNRLEVLADSISAHERAIELMSEGNPGMHRHHTGLALSFEMRFELLGHIKDLETAIARHKKAIDCATYVGAPHLCQLLGNLGHAQEQLFVHTQSRVDFEAAVESYSACTLQPAGHPSTRLRFASHCARLLTDNPAFVSTESLLLAHARVIAILPEMVWLGHDVHRRYEESSKIGEHVNAAVSAAIAAGALTRAVEWLEAGRTLIWSQALSLRTPLEELRNAHPGLADSLHDVQLQLQSSAHSVFNPDNDMIGGVVGLNMNSAADRHRGLVVERDKLLKEIRECPGFESFLRPKTYEALITSLKLADGPFVFINVHKIRCDALVLLPDSSITHIHLHDLSMNLAKKWHAQWVTQLKACGVRQRATWGHSPPTSQARSVSGLTRLLRLIWEAIVYPISKALNLDRPSNTDRLTHITWCPTGPLTQLPLHAAGVYDKPIGPRAFDLIVSSYAPSLSAFRHSMKVPSQQRTSPSALIVTQPATPDLPQLPGTVEEKNRLEKVLSAAKVKYYTLHDQAATVTSVREVLSQYPWVHLACHGSQHIGDATLSAFALHDGPLSLRDLMGVYEAVDNAELAFLSACQTATGDERNPEEAAHLAAGMLVVGFKGVVATLWSIGDDDAPIVVEAYYRKLLEQRSSGNMRDGETGAAYALHEAVRVLRETVGEREFLKWAPFVHFGV